MENGTERQEPPPDRPPGAVYREFQRELDRLARRYAGRPREEMLRLCLLALEREELVSVGYRESLITSRLSTMDLPDRVRQAIHHALVWIWKDEEMHSIYIRGAILRIGMFHLRLRAFIGQAAGGLGGWASSVLQHLKFREAPVSRTLAGAVTAMGSLLGKVPAEVRRSLTYGPFREFCLFNIDAEKTAALCWRRLVELAPGQPDVGPELTADFQRVVEDEERHGRIFEIFARALGGGDRLVPGVTADSLLSEIRSVGEVFLPRAERRVPPVENPLGTGGRVWSLAGIGPEDKHRLFRRLLEESGLFERLEERLRFLGKAAGEARVAVKTTFMMGYHKRDPSPLLDPSLLVDLARYLRERGVGDVAVVDGRNIYDHFFKNRSVAEVARYFGIGSPDFRVVDVSEEQVPHRYERGLAQSTISRTWKEADFRISFGKLRSHPVELVFLTVANLESVGSRCDEFLFIERQAHRNTATMMLQDECPSHFALLDAYEQAPDGLVGVMGCRRPRSPRRFYAGVDALAVDTVAGRHLGLKHPQQSSILRAACHWFGGWPERIEVVGTDQPIDGWRGPYHNEIWALMSILSFPIYVFGSRRGSLFVPEMDPSAFPPLKPEGLFLRWGRRTVRALLGLRLPRSTEPTA